MNVSITDIQKWAYGTAPREYWYTYNRDIMSACSMFSSCVDEYIHSQGKSSISRVFMLDEDKDMHKRAYEYAKKATVEYFLFAVTEYKERFGCNLYLVNSYMTDDYIGVKPIDGLFTKLSSKQEY